jgi:hypothetical protein
MLQWRRRANRTDIQMPLMRYFLFIGGALLAMLFISDAFVPKEAVMNGTVADAGRPAQLRIQSDQKWPERIVIDTSLPTISVAQPALPVIAAAPKAVADIDTTTAPLEAYAQVRVPESKAPEPKVRKRRVAKLPRQPAMASSQPSGLDFFAWR